jgi:hypothetical protein
MSDPLYAQIIAWVGLALLLLVCLPFARIQKVVLTVCAGALRLALLAVVGSAAYLWFRPEDLPAEVASTLDNVGPLLGPLMPTAGTPHFGVCIAGLIVLLFLPLLLVLDVGRKIAGLQIQPVRPVSEQPNVVAAPPPVVRRTDRRAAAATLAEAGARLPSAARSSS